MSGKKLKLYHNFPYRSLRCTHLIEELGARDDFEYIPVSPYAADKGVKDFEKINPHGTIPTLVLEDGTSLFDSAAILFYLAERYGKFLPPPNETANYYNWTVYASATGDMILYPLIHQQLKEQADIDKQVKKFHDFAKYFTEFMKDREYICGDTFTAADCQVIYGFFCTKFVLNGVLLNDYPLIQQYIARICNRPAYAEAYSVPEGFTAADCGVFYTMFMTNAVLGGVLLNDYPLIQQYVERIGKRPAHVEAYKVPEWYVPGVLP